MNGRQLLLGVGVVGFIIIISVMIFRIDWGGNSTPAENLVNRVKLVELADTSTELRMTARGPIINNQEHQEIQITVGRDLTTGNLLTGYTGTVSRTEQTPNNQESFRAFLSALDNAEFVKTKNPKSDQQYDGACAGGIRYTFEFIDASQDGLNSSWATGCSKRDGTFDGNLSEVKKLFGLQLPKSQLQALTTGVSFY